MKFVVPNYSCIQNPWLRGYRPQIPVFSVLCPQLNFLNPPPPEKNSWVRHCCSLFFLRPKSLPQLPIFEYPQPIFLPWCDRPVSKPRFSLFESFYSEKAKGKKKVFFLSFLNGKRHCPDLIYSAVRRAWNFDFFCVLLKYFYFVTFVKGVLAVFVSSFLLPYLHIAW